MLQNAATDLGLHCLPIIQKFLDMLPGNKKDFFKVLESMVKVSQCLVLIWYLDTCLSREKKCSSHYLFSQDDTKLFYLYFENYKIV